MAFSQSTRLGIGGVALAALVVAGAGFVQPPAQQLPTVTVWHSPT